MPGRRETGLGRSVDRPPAPGETRNLRLRRSRGAPPSAGGWSREQVNGGSLGGRQGA